MPWLNVAVPSSGAEPGEPGRVSVDDVNDLLKLQIEAEDFDTIGGYVQSQLGASPRVGATLQLGQATLKVEAVRGSRIKKVRIHSEQPFQIPQADLGQPTVTSTPPRSSSGDARR